MVRKTQDTSEYMRMMNSGCAESPNTVRRLKEKSTGWFNFSFEVWPYVGQRMAYACRTCCTGNSRHNRYCACARRSFQRYSFTKHSSSGGSGHHSSCRTAVWLLIEPGAAGGGPLLRRQSRHPGNQWPLCFPGVHSQTWGRACHRAAGLFTSDQPLRYPPPHPFHPCDPLHTSTHHCSPTLLHPALLTLRIPRDLVYESVPLSKKAVNPLARMCQQSRREGRNRLEDALAHGAGADAFLLESLFRNDAWGFLLKPVSLENETAVFTSMMEGCRYEL